jgi:hypothetical protein
MPASVINGDDSGCCIDIPINYDDNSKKDDACSADKAHRPVGAALGQRDKLLRQQNKGLRKQKKTMSQADVRLHS